MNNNNVRVCWQDTNMGNTDIKNYKNILYAPNLNMDENNIPFNVSYRQDIFKKY